MANILLSTPSRSVIFNQLAIPVTMADIGLTQSTRILRLDRLAIPVGMAAIGLSQQVLLPEPEYEIPLNNPGVQAGMDIFTPNVSPLTVPAGPTIARLSEEAWPGHSFNMVGKDFTANLGLRFYSQSTTLNQVGVHDTAQAWKRRLNGNIASWTVPDTILPGTELLVWPETVAGIGRPRLMNRASPEWLCGSSTGYNVCFVGDTVSVLGRNLCKPILSASSVAIGTGTKTFQVAAGLSFAAGQKLLILARSVTQKAGGANFMDATVTSYSGTTLTTSASASTGSGTFTSWKIYPPIARVYLEVAGMAAFASVQYADPWCIEFALPASVSGHALVPGDLVTVKVHNNMGGKYGYKTCPHSLFVETPATLGMNYGNTIAISPSGDTTGATDRNAINAAFASSTSPRRVLLSAGIYWVNGRIFPVGNFGVSGLLEGAGKASTTIRAVAAANFAGDSMFSGFSSTGFCRLKNLKVETNTNNTFGSQGVCHGIGFDNVNVVATGARVTTFNWGGGGGQWHGYAVSSDFTGYGGFANQPLSVYVKSNTFHMTEGDIGDQAQMPFYLWNANKIYIARNTIQDLTIGGSQTERGSGKFVTLAFNSYDSYIARNTTIQLSPLTADGNANSGEQILTEGNSGVEFSAFITSQATVGGVTRLTFSSYTGPSTGQVFVIEGLGQGQGARVANVSGNQVTLDQLLAVTLDTTSKVAVAHGGSNNVAVMNVLNGNNQTATASAGYQTFNASFRSICQHNTISDMVYAWSDWGQDVDEPCYWNLIADNAVSHCENATRSIGGPDMRFIGNLYTRNVALTCSQSEFWVESGPTYPLGGEGNIVDNCYFSGAPIGIKSVNGTTPTQYLLLYNTSFVGNMMGEAISADGYYVDLQGTSSMTGFTGGGPTPPAQPTGLLATPVSSTRINLIWNSALGATSYTLQRATDAINWTTIVSQGATAYSDITVTRTTNNYYYRVRAVNAAGNSSWSILEFVPHVTSSTVIIDSTWLTANGPEPYVLTTANATYSLDDDVTTDGTAFVIGNASIVFDLNGKTIIYGDRAPVALLNGSFETAGPANWTLNGAGIARITVPGPGWQSSFLMRFTGASAQDITSDAFSLPVANQQYVATCTVKGDDGATVTLAIINSADSVVLATVTSVFYMPDGGELKVTYSPTTTKTVKIKVTVTPSGSDTIYVDNVTTRYGGDCGIFANVNPASGPHPYPLQLQISKVTTNAPNAATVVIMNGTVEQGQALSYEGHSVDCYGMPNGITLHEVEATSNGMEGTNLFARFGEDIRLTNCNLTVTSTFVFNRQAIYAQVRVDDTEGTVAICGNEMNGSPQSCIYSERYAGTMLIDNNDFDQIATYADPYAIHFYDEMDGVTITNNRIGQRTWGTTYQGRGIMLSNEELNVSVHDNIVYAYELPTLEFNYDGMEATALRMRNFANSVSNVEIYQNQFIATTDGALHGSMGARLTMTNVSNLSIHDNIFRATSSTLTPASGFSEVPWARAFGLSQFNATTTIQNNLFESNDMALSLGDNDSYALNNQNAIFRSNIFGKIVSGPARTYIPVMIGDWNNAVNAVKLYGATFIGSGNTGYTFNVVGAGGNVAWGDYAQSKNVTVGWLVVVTVTSSTTGLPISGVTVISKNTSAATDDTQTTDANGQCTVLCIVDLWNQAGNNAGGRTDTSYKPHTLNVSKAGYTTQNGVTLGTLTANGTRAVSLVPV
jgi:hypothetical protein